MLAIQAKHGVFQVVRAGGSTPVMENPRFGRVNLP
jgi:hypothetical protein